MAALLGYPCSLTIPRNPALEISASRPRLQITREGIRPRRIQQTVLRCVLTVDTSTAEQSTSRAPALEYEVSYRKQSGVAYEGAGRGWTDAEGNFDQRLLADFRALVVIAGDRVEMHNVLARQRSNWNHLFHSTIVVAAVSAAAAAAISGAEPGLGLTVMATFLNFVCAAFMALVNKEQPSQLAEEQIKASRFFKRLMMEIEATLQIDPRLREEASVYWGEKVATLHALDGTFPLPLSPQGLEKFPPKVLPAELSGPANRDDKNDKDHSQKAVTHDNGWSHKTELYLRQSIERIHNRDIPYQIKWAQKAKILNLAMARTSPFLAAGGAFCSIANAVPIIPVHVPWLAAVLTVGALFTHSVSHALQLGSAFELHRDYAGYYADIVRAADRVLRLPAWMREDWILFIQRFNLQLGHNAFKETVNNNQHTAGKLF